MINEIYVEMLATKIFDGEMNPNTSLPFMIEDIKKEEYIEPVKAKLEEMEGLANDRTI